MSENNDKKVKEILMANEIPQELEPENIKKMLDEKKAQTKKPIKFTAIKIVSAAAACAVVCTFAVQAINKKDEFRKSAVTDNKSSSNAISKVTKNRIMYMSGADDYSEIYSCFRTASDDNRNIFKRALDKLKGEEYYYTNGDAVTKEADMEEAVAGEYTTADASAETSGVSEQTNEFTDTYNQVEGVAEADIVKTDGKNIYYAFEYEIKIASVDNGKFTNTSTLEFDSTSGEPIQDMYLVDDRLIVISSGYPNYYGCYVDVDEGYYYSDTDNSKVTVSIYSTGLNPELIGTYSQDGWYNDVRLIDGYMYLVSDTTSENYTSIKNENDIKSYIPRCYCNGKERFIKPDDILLPEEKIENAEYMPYTIIGGINILAENPSETADVKALANNTGYIYCSKDNLYVTGGYAETSITRLSLSEGRVAPCANGNVKGHIKDQFSMSEYNGYFRIATTFNDTVEDSYYENNSMITTASLLENNALYVLAMDMNEVGNVSNFGVTESIKSVNFDGDMAYVVTYEQTDPLFAIDLSNPQTPTILDEYKINGYSTYMQRWNENLLLGFGVEADDNAIETGLKLVMFDTSDPNDLKEVGKITLGDIENQYISSNALWERKALYIDPERNLISFPVTEEYYGYDDFYEYKINYKNVFYSYENGEFIYKGEADFSDVYENAWSNFNSRVLYINGFLYVADNKEFISLDLNTFEVIDKHIWSDNNIE